MNTTVIDRPAAGVARDERSGGVWDYVSASRLNLWLRCPLAFKLRYIDGVRSPPSPAMFLGRQVHSALEYFYRHWQLGVTLPPEVVVEQLTSSWNEAGDLEHVAFQSHIQSHDLQSLAARLVDQYLHLIPDDEPRPLAVETRLESRLIDPHTGEDLGLPLVGVVDLVLPSADGAVLIDFKTAARCGRPSALLHEIQMTAYSILFRELSGEDESHQEIRQLVKDRGSSVECHRYQAADDQRVHRFFNIVREFIAALRRQQFTFRPHWSCKSCDFHARCSGQVGSAFG